MNSNSSFRSRFPDPFVWASMIIILLFVFYWLYLAQLYIVVDPNMEAMDAPLTVGYLEAARDQGVSAKQYFEDKKIWSNLIEQNEKRAFAYPGGRFQFEFFAYQHPFLNLCYLPFVHMVGVSSKAIALYSTFFSAFALLLGTILAYQLFGRDVAVLSCLLLLSSLSWLIHTKIGYAAWMPSVTLMNGLLLCLYSYARSLNPNFLIIAGALFGLMYLVGWLVVVFGLFITALVLGLVLFLKGRLHLKPIFAHACYFVLSAIFTILVVCFIYTAYFRCDFFEIHKAICDVMFVRYSQGAIPAYRMSVIAKIVYAFKCMFLDMETLDHLDKALEGRPSIPYLFGILFFVGIFYALKEQSFANKLCLISFAAIFGFLCTGFNFAHRYALLVLPAMSIIAARGAIGLVADFSRFSTFAGTMIKMIIACGLFLSIFVTHRQYYKEYTFNKPADFEVDRIRGHAAATNWIKSNYSPEDTLIVLGDPVFFPHTAFLFHTFYKPYRFVYWTNYFQNFSDAKDLLNWEKEVLSRYKQIVFFFSSQFLAESDGAYFNDWVLFFNTHPDLEAKFIYSYENRGPSFYAFEISAQTYSDQTSPMSSRTRK